MTVYQTVYQVEWRHYRRSFRQPLQTHHGSWSVREGILVCLRDAQRVGWGEIAPIPWFGSETIDQAIEYCQSLAGQITAAQIAEISDCLPACQFGLEAALENLQSGLVDFSGKSALSYSVLLSPDSGLEADKFELEERSDKRDESCTSPLNPPQVGDFEDRRFRSIEKWGVREAFPSASQIGATKPLKVPQNGGFRGHKALGGFRGQQSHQPLSENLQKTFKCKIGVSEIDCEMSQLDRLLQILPDRSKLRLDANGGLSESEAHRWLEWCDRRSQGNSQIELIEQPLPPDQFLQMQQLSQQFQTPIALDESVATLQQLRDCYEQGWRGIVVIKPAIAGFPSRLRQFCQEVQPDVVWSSALETAIGRRYIEHCLIPATGLTQRAIGFGVDHWFADDWGQQPAEFLWRDLAHPLARPSVEVSP